MHTGCLTQSGDFLKSRNLSGTAGFVLTSSSQSILSLGRVFLRPVYGVNGMNNITGLDYKIKEMARRIYELREIENLTTAQMAEKNGRKRRGVYSLRKGRKRPKLCVYLPLRYRL